MTEILHLLAPATVGGTETVVEALTEGQTRRGHGVAVGVVVEPEEREHPLLSRLSRAGVPASPLIVPRRAYLQEIRAVRSLLRRDEPRLVHTHGYHGDVVAGTVARRSGVPVVSTVHGFTRGDWKNRLYEGLQRRVLRRFDGVVAVSGPLAEELSDAGVATARLHVIPNAAPDGEDVLEPDRARDRLKLDSDAFVAGWVGRLSHEKGPDLFLRALGLLGGQDVRGVLVGEGPEGERLRTLTTDLGIGDRVQFAGRMPRASKLFRAFDVFVLSSRTEGTPMTLFEAMVARVPVVATRVGGVPDVVDGSVALLIPPGDTEALARAIREVRCRPGAARGRADRAFQRVRTRFDERSWLDAYDDVYRDVLKKRAGGSPG